MATQDSRSSKAYVWVTWLRDLIVIRHHRGYSKCQWRLWYKANYRYAKRKVKSNFNMPKWQKEHDEMTEARVKKMKAEEDWDILRVEDDNSFKLDGRTAVLAGKPDIVGVKTPIKTALVVDEKSGKKRVSDEIQVCIYMWSLPMVWASGWQILGEVEYRDGPKAVTQTTLDYHTPAIIEGMKILGGDNAPPRTPSVSECRGCDILACPDRPDIPEDEGDASKLF